MKSQFPQTWLGHSSREISGITGNSGFLWCFSFEDGESESYTNEVKLKMIVVSG